MTATFRLTEREHADLARDGYVARERAFDLKECAAISGACEELLVFLTETARKTKHEAGAYVFEMQRRRSTMLKWEKENRDVIHGIEPFAHLSKPLMDSAHDPRFLDPARDVLGREDVALFTEKLNVKRADVGGPAVLHQDYPYWVDVTQDPAEVMTAMLFLDDATRENGCLEVAPGSHREGEAARRKVEGFGMFEMDPAKFDLGRLVPVEVPAGSVIYFGSLLVHRSQPNRSQADRRALLYSYQPAGRPHMREGLYKGKSA